jgi:deoxycytidylate deaminase
MLTKGFFRLARNVSKYSEIAPQMGAVIAQKKPISVGFNKAKTAYPYNKHSTHAEISAVISSDRWDLTDCEIYIYRETNDGFPAMARPCEKCMKILKSCGIKKIYYTVSEYPFWKSERI